MRDWPGADPTEVRAADLAAAAAVVTRFRRRRRATVAAALSAGVVAVMAQHTFFSVPSASLVPTDSPPSVTPEGSASPSPSATPTAPPSRPALGGGPVTGVPSAPAAPGLGAPPPGGDAPEPRTPAARRRAPFRIGMVRTQYRGTAGNCGIAFAPRATVCTASKGSQQKNGSVVLVYRACLTEPRVFPATLTFRTAKEVDFAVTTEDGKRVLWQWSTGQRFAETPHSLPLAEDLCYQWRTRWTGVLDDGTRVAPGKYGLRAAGRDTGNLLTTRITTITISG